MFLLLPTILQPNNIVCAFLDIERVIQFEINPSFLSSNQKGATHIYYS